MRKKLALQTLFTLTAWFVLQNFNVSTVDGRPSTVDGGKNTQSLVAGNPVDRLPSAVDRLPSTVYRLPFPGYKIKKVVLDAGHGGKDPGCIGASSHEKHNTLAIALKIGALITENCPDVQVVYTRTTDEFIDLKERAAIANRHKADLFISIHCNAISAAHFHGTETYVLGLHRAGDNLEVAKRENAVILMEDNYQQNYAGYDPRSPEAHILGSMWQSAYLEQSILFASLVQQHAQSIAGRADKGVKQAGFLVLRETAMPAVLVETGFLTNRAEEIFIASEEGQSQMAQAIFMAFLHYRSQMEGTPLPTPKPTAVAANKTAKPAQPAPTAGTPTTTSPPAPKPKSTGVADKPAPAKTEPPKTTPAARPASTPATAAAFRIHLFSWPVRMDMQSGLLGLLSNVQEENTGGEYRYFVGHYTTRAEAERMLPELRNLGFRTAEIVPAGTTATINN